MVLCGLLGSPAVIVGGMDMMSQAVMLAKKRRVVIGEWAGGFEEGLGGEGGTALGGGNEKSVKG